ncbi:MAG: UDP-N-acetylmuramoyl-L-alanyl-D-glutamate--2,6-diaminopimelate ligase, partial [Muribaculaceae bacterium]|nr:UDP-N-acetylmuramoyl-L-alanyl-D-glutamate--2,6-diaminopimelate ligase [Muribaculaceae bacterium]
TPDALVNVLDTIAEIRRPGQQIITVCGCGGDRDRGKRPIMAAEAARRSDRVILTSDNPRSEDPLAIIDEMRAGLDDEARKRTFSVTDRAEAIRLAAELANAGDIILVAGKGHETYQIIGNETHHFDDREQLAALGFSF